MDAKKSKMPGKIKHVIVTMVDKVKIINLKKLKSYEKHDEYTVAHLLTLKLVLDFSGEQQVLSFKEI
jgi:hypothetical protein